MKISFQEFKELNLIDSKKAFEKLYDVFAEDIYKIILRRVKNESDTDDLLQTTFVKVWQNISKFKGDSAMYSWVYRIAINETNMFFRKKKDVIISDDSNYIFDQQVYNSFPLPPDKIDSFLFEAIESLPKKQKLIFELRYFDEVQFKKIAIDLSLSEGSVKASYHIARKKVEENFISKLNFLQ